MSAFIIVNIEVHDPKQFGEYKTLVEPTLEAYGGRYLVRGGRTEVLEGEWDLNRLVIIQFDSVERARAWWSSEEYREPKELRQRASTSQMVVAEGL